MGERAGYDIDIRKVIEKSIRDNEIHEESFIRLLLERFVEIKNDERCWRKRPTGKLAIEHRQHSGPSGIATTEADTWAIQFDHRCWLLLPTERLRAIHAAAFQELGEMPMGDNGNFGVCIPIQRFVERPKD